MRICKTYQFSKNPEKVFEELVGVNALLKEKKAFTLIFKGNNGIFYDIIITLEEQIQFFEEYRKRLYKKLKKE